MLRARAIADGHHRHHGEHADDDAQRGEAGAHFVAAQGAQRDQRRQRRAQQQFRAASRTSQLTCCSAELGLAALRWSSRARSSSARFGVSLTRS